MKTRKVVTKLFDYEILHTHDCFRDLVVCLKLFYSYLKSNLWDWLDLKFSNVRLEFAVYADTKLFVSFWIKQYTVLKKYKKRRGRKRSRFSAAVDRGSGRSSDQLADQRERTFVLIYSQLFSISLPLSLILTLQKYFDIKNSRAIQKLKEKTECEKIKRSPKWVKKGSMQKRIIIRNTQEQRANSVNLLQTNLTP